MDGNSQRTHTSGRGNVVVVIQLWRWGRVERVPDRETLEQPWRPWPGRWLLVGSARSLVHSTYCVTHNRTGDSGLLPTLPPLHWPISRTVFESTSGLSGLSGPSELWGWQQSSLLYTTAYYMQPCEVIA